MPARFLSVSLVLSAWCLCAAPTHADDAQLIEVRLTAGPHPPGDAPDLILHIPSYYEPRQPLDLVVFLHGFDGCTRALVAERPVPCRTGEPAHRVWDLARLHEQAGTNTILIVPQLAYLARTAKGHRFATQGAFDAMLREVLAGHMAPRLGATDLSRIRSVTLVAHSAGYGAALTILTDATRAAPVEHVVLLDALYAGFQVFAAWAKQTESHHLISLYTAQEKTQAGNRALLRELSALPTVQRIDGKIEHALRSSPRVVAQVRTAHGDMPRAHFASVLRGLPFNPRPTR